MKFTCQSEVELKQVCLYLQKKLDGRIPALVTISGEMGAGKTTLVRNLVRLYNPNIHVNSPTYNLIHTYRVSSGLEFFHFDLYRIQTFQEMDELGFEEIWGKKGISLIEWSEKAGNFLPDPTLKVLIQITDDETREILILDGI